MIMIVFMSNIAKGQLVINELMARNNGGISDEFGEFDDWIEIYNPTGEDVDIAGGYFTDNIGNPTLHLIESGQPALTTIPANGYKIFWADGTPDQGANHLGFSLSAGGESVALVLSDGEFIVDAVQFSDQENDISYGRESDGAILFQFFSVPTPNASNQFIPPALQTIHINEVQPLNTSTIVDESGVYESWLELYNPNDSQVNLAGYILDYNNGEASFVIENSDPNSTVIESNNHKLFWCDNQVVEGLLHTNFELSASGVIRLYYVDGVTLVDEFIYNNVEIDSSFGSQNDGSDDYVTFDIPTPDVTNQLEVVFPELLFINELMASNLSDTTDNYGEFEDWIEIYNPNSFPVDLSGYYLSDNLGGGSWEIPSLYPDSVTVPAQGFLVFWADNDEEQGVRHTDFKLTTSGETLVLLSTDNFTVADSESFPLQSSDVSWGREVDGESEWVYFIPESTTPEYSNHGAVSVGELSVDNYDVFPNPTNGVMYVNGKVDSIEVFSLKGELLLTISDSNKVDLSSFSSGLYVLRCDLGFRLLVEKI